jgi:ribosomal-protein-alanine N-acetyltransferase
MPLPTIQTARLTLRPWTVDDIDELHTLWTQPEVRRYLWDDHVITREQAEETVREFTGAEENEGLGGWVMLDSNAAIVGFVGLIRRNKDPELLYGLAPHAWGHGFATEASRAVLAYAFDVLGVERITANTDTPNTASVRVLERLGMRFTHEAAPHGLALVFYELQRDAFLTQLNTARH